MQKIKSTFTVYFENPFWVGVYERLENGKLSVCKITFGSEPKDYEVYEFLLANWHNLHFSPAIKSKHLTERKTNPKRLQRDIRKQLSSKGIGTKAQLSFSLELVGLFIVGYWGFTLPTRKFIRVAIGLAVPVLVIVIWSIWCAPSSVHRLENFRLVALKCIVFTLVILCLVYMKHPVAAIIFALLVVLNLGLSAYWGTL